MPLISNAQQTSVVQRICQKQGIPCDTTAIGTLVDLGQGDIRYVLNSLQAVVLVAGKVTDESVKEAGLTSKESVHNLDDFWRLLFLCHRDRGSGRKGRE